MLKPHRVVYGRRSTTGPRSGILFFDNQEVSSIGDVTLAPSNPDIVWVGTGEANNRQSSSRATAFTNRQTAARPGPIWDSRTAITSGGSSVHPTNPDIVMWLQAGISGGRTGSVVTRPLTAARRGSMQNSLMRTRGFTDVAMDPSDPNILYAAAYQRRRT
ncbi:MAG: hypothetical protein IPJ07_20530 [Acidobacteria bacterium]|nr:hypothetical protein [Acidobacteriota bacterium]